MGFFKKVFRPVRKIAKKIIPKEVRPFLPYIAAAFGPAAGGIAGMGFQEAAKKLALKGIIAGSTAAATDEDANILRTSLLAAAPAALEGGLGAISTKYGSSPLLKSGIPKSLQQLPGSGDPAQFFSETVLEQGLSPTSGSIGTSLANAAGKAGSFIGKQGNVKTIGAQTALDQSAKFAEIRQDEIDAYNRNLLEQGVASKVDRRNAIFGIYKNAGYDDDYVNTMLDTYGYADGGRIGFAGGGNYESYKDYLEQLPNNEVLFDLYLAGDMAGLMRELKRRGYDTSDDYASGGRIGFANGGYRGRAEEALGLTTMKDLLKGNTKVSMRKKDDDDDDDDDSQPRKRRRREPDMARGLTAAMNAVQTAYGRPFGEMEPVPMMRFARGGEVEIEEQTDDLGIMDLMRDQGVEYGEQVSNAQNDELLEKLFEEFLDLGFSPEDAAKKAREAFDDMSQGQGIKGTQVASGYKDDIEEMYEQYVFEMEEQGLKPMDFASYLRQAQSGMASGGRVGFTKGGDVMRGVNRGIDPLEVLDILREFKRIKKKYDYEMSFDDYLDGEMFAKGGRVNYAGGGASYNSSSRYSFLIDKYNKGIPLTPSEADELEMLEMTYADDSQGKAEGGIMNKNLLNTGMDKDMRGGGFIPEGTKEKADDVPARLSKNEFVMTADAVRAAGGGSVNEGAKRMYETMHKLEAKV